MSRGGMVKLRAPRTQRALLVAVARRPRDDRSGSAARRRALCAQLYSASAGKRERAGGASCLGARRPADAARPVALPRARLGAAPRDAERGRSPRQRPYSRFARRGPGAPPPCRVGARRPLTGLSLSPAAHRPLPPAPPPPPPAHPRAPRAQSAGGARVSLLGGGSGEFALAAAWGGAVDRVFTVTPASDLRDIMLLKASRTPTL